MSLHVLKKGLALPLAGEPVQVVEDSSSVSSVALLGDDYVGLRPRFLVEVGQEVKRGQPLFEDRKNPGIVYASPGGGTVAAINRGARRAFQSLVIKLAEAEEDVVFQAWREGGEADGDAVRALLVESGLWTAFRTRPFSKVPAPDAIPQAIFVTAMDTHPHAPEIDVVLKTLDPDGSDFRSGLALVAKLTSGTTWLCRARGSSIEPGGSGVEVADFAGKHPAGSPGTHIHFLEPVHRGKVAWHIGYQDVVAVGRLFRTGALAVERVVSLAGPGVSSPRLLRTRLGASLDDLTKGELKDGEQRIVSGSVLHGRTASGPVHGYLGRYNTQVAVLSEGRERHFLGWAAPGGKSYSTIPAFLSCLFRGRRFEMNTDSNGSERAMVPIGMYERVMPLDILPTFLLRALASGDLERAEALGALELDEEDLALCTFVCPSKIDYGKLLRETLDQIEKEG